MDYCPNCNADLGEVVEYYEDPVIFGSTYHSWHYECPNCGKKWCYTEYFMMINSEIKEET